MIVLDTSGLLAALDADQRHHHAAREALEADPGPFLLSPFVLAELDYLLLTRLGVKVETALLRQVVRGAYQLAAFNSEELAAATEVIERYSDQNIGLADASIVVLAARARTTRLLTLDQRHFRTVRPLWGEGFILLPADNS